MIKKIFSSIFACVCMLTCCAYLTACGGSGDVETIKNRVTLKLPNKVHVEYQGGTIYIQDGQEVYAKADSYYSSDRPEVYVKLNLSNPVVFAEPQYAQGYITARYANLGGGHYDWQCADADTNYSHWHANDHNYTVYANAEKELRSGYDDINVPYEMANLTISKFSADYTLRVGDMDIKCVVWDSVYDDGETYVKTRVWFANDTSICLKKAKTYNKTDDVNSLDNVTFKAVVYKTGESMATALASLEEARTPYVFADQYV